MKFKAFLYATATMFKEFVQSLPRPIAIIGMGQSGLASQKLLLLAGVSADEILLYDDTNPNAQFSSSDVLIAQGQPRTLLVSPGVPLVTEWIQNLLKSGVRLISELELAFALLTSEKCIAVTGSIGKSTVTSLIGAGARAIDPNAFVGGNLGTPLAAYAAEVLQGRARAEWIVLELSSYQLENFSNLTAAAAVFTYLTPNHLERYPDLETYYETKWRLLKYCKGPVFLNAQGGDLLKFAKRAASPSGLNLQWVNLAKAARNLPIQLLGNYNYENFLLACAVADHFQWGVAAVTAMQAFPGLLHRLENLGQHRGILFINDSKATTMESVLSAVETVAGTRPTASQLWLLLGGHDKNLPWEQLRTLSSTANLRPIFFGEYGAQSKIKTNLVGPVYATLADAVRALPGLVATGDTVLLSPGGTSHDEFKNFEERGNFFRANIQKLFA